MKSLLIFVASLSSLSAHADYVLEPFFDAAYACNWFEGEGSEIQLLAGNIEDATAEATAYLNQSLAVNCVRAEYTCVHHGDVEPRLVSKKSTSKSLKVLGGDIIDTHTKQTVGGLPGVGYHKNLRLPPRCGY